MAKGKLRPPVLPLGSSLQLRGTDLSPELRKSTTSIQRKCIVAAVISTLLLALCIFLSLVFSDSLLGLIATNLIRLLAVSTVFTLGATFVVTVVLGKY